MQRTGETFIQSLKDFFHDNGPQWAAAVAYYSLLSTVPLLLAIASISAFFIDPQWAVQQATMLLGGFLPMGENQLESVVIEAIEARGQISLISIALLLWTGTRVFGAITMALNIAFDADEPYGFFRRTLVELLMVMTIGFLFVIALSSRLLINMLWETFQPASGNGQELTLQLVLESVSGLLLIITFFLLYHFVPRRRVDWRAALFGAVLAAFLLLAGRPLFVTYVQQFADYNLFYGSLAIVIILIFWAWLVAVIILFVGELVSHIQMIFIEERPTEEVERQHLLRSPKRKNV